jgi:polysaccharide biosynthesis/export protein
MKSLPFLALLLLSLFLASCITSQKLTYLQETGISADSVAMSIPQDYKIQPFDNLFIRVATPDPKWSDMFNLVQTTAANTTLTEQSADLISYSVDREGKIDFPYAGKFEVAGKTREMIKTDLETALKAYVTDASITVKMINNYVSIIGEVKNPGKYLIYKDRMNIFQALAMAGDVGDFGDRQRIQIIRQEAGKAEVKEFSLNDRNILATEYYYVMPNDVIYAMPVKGRFFQMNAFPYALILSAITTLLLFWNVVE